MEIREKEDLEENKVVKKKVNIEEIKKDNEKLEERKFGIWYSDGDDVTNNLINLWVMDGCVSLNKKERECLKTMLCDPVPISSDGEFEDITDIEEALDEYLKDNDFKLPTRD